MGTVHRMANFTNIHNIDDAVVQALTKDSYVRVGDISATGLVAPAQATYLMRKHHDELVFDISEKVYKWIGTVIHAEIAKVPLPEGGIKEQRFVTGVDDWEVSGQIDRWVDGTLTDYKTTSAFQYSKATKGEKPEWEKQLNIYAAILRRNGYAVDRCQIVVIIRDHSMGRSEQDGYPVAAVQTIEMRCWPPEDADAYLVERVRAHQFAVNGDFDDCTPEERWAKPDLWAVKKRGGAKALRVFDDDQTAREFAASAAGLEVEFRPGGSARCQVWCKAFPFCEQAKAEKAAKAMGYGVEG